MQSCESAQLQAMKGRERATASDVADRHGQATAPVVATERN